MVATVGRQRQAAPRPRHMAGGTAPRHLRPRRDPLRRARPVVTAIALVAVTAATAVTTLHRPGDAGAPTLPVLPVAAGPAPAACPDPASLATRAGLVLVVGLPGVTEADDPLVDLLADVGVGGVMLRDENLRSRRQAQDLVDGLRARLGEHLLVAVDEEGGRVTSLRGLGHSTPSARRLGRSGPEAARAAGEDLGEIAASIGIDWVFAPVVDLDDGPADGVIGDRSFGGDPLDVAEAAGAFADGLHHAGVAVTVKHFPGHGSADSDPHSGVAIDDRSRAALLRADIRPFDALVEEGAEAVMVAHVEYPQLFGSIPASLSPDAYALLRARGFDGVAITDALGMGAVYNRWGFGEAPALAIDAGADAVLVNQGDRVLELRNGIVSALRVGELDEARLDEAVGRVLALRHQDSSTILCA